MLRIGYARDIAELWAVLLAYLSDTGFDRIVYGVIPHWREGTLRDTKDFIYFSNYSGDAMKPIFDIGIHSRTATYRWLMQNTGPISWQWSEDERVAGRLSPSEMEAQTIAARAGLQAGYSISFPDPSPRSRAAISLGAVASLNQADVDALWQARGGEIHAVCLMAHLKFRSMPYPIERQPLSPRQREALEWVAEGKTTQDISTIMGISPAMVEKHLRRARQALDVETTAHAVARAVLFNRLFTERVTTENPPEG